MRLKDLQFGTPVLNGEEFEGGDIRFTFGTNTQENHCGYERHYGCEYHTGCESHCGYEHHDGGEYHRGWIQFSGSCSCATDGFDGTNIRVNGIAVVDPSDPSNKVLLTYSELKSHGF